MFCNILLCALIAAVEAPRFEATTIGPSVTGELTSLTANGAATVGQQGIHAGALVELHQVGRPRPPKPTERAHVRLAGGDLWPMRLVDLLDDKLRIVADFGTPAELSLPVAQVS